MQRERQLYLILDREPWILAILKLTETLYNTTQFRFNIDRDLCGWQNDLFEEQITFTSKPIQLQVQML